MRPLEFLAQVSDWRIKQAAKKLLELLTSLPMMPVPSILMTGAFPANCHQLCLPLTRREQHWL